MASPTRPASSGLASSDCRPPTAVTRAMEGSAASGSDEGFRRSGGRCARGDAAYQRVAGRAGNAVRGGRPESSRTRQDQAFAPTFTSAGPGSSCHGTARSGVPSAPQSRSSAAVALPPLSVFFAARTRRSRGRVNPT